MSTRHQFSGTRQNEHLASRAFCQIYERLVNRFTRALNKEGRRNRSALRMCTCVRHARMLLKNEGIFDRGSIKRCDIHTLMPR